MKKVWFIGFLIFIIFLSMLPLSVRAQECNAIGGESVADSYVITIDRGDPPLPAIVNLIGFSDIAIDGNGNFVMAWRALDASGYGIYAQRYDKNGDKVGTKFQVNTYTNGDQFDQSIAMDPQGNFVIVWVSRGQDGSSLGVFAQRFNAQGEKLGSEFQVNTFTTGDQYRPTIAIDSQGNFVIVWVSRGQDGSGYGIYAQRFDAQGNKLEQEFQVNTYTSDDQSDSSVAMDINGNFVVTWINWGPADNEIDAQRFDSNGNRIGGELQVISAPSFYPPGLAIALGHQGNFVITWSDLNNVYAQRFDTQGNKLGSKFQVNINNNIGAVYPDITIDSQSNFVIAWSRGNFPIYAQRFDSQGNRLGSESQVSNEKNSSDGDPYVAMDSQGNFVVTWLSKKNSWFSGSNNRYLNIEVEIVSRILRCPSLTCFNKVKDENETDVDCGGNCPTCSDGKICSVNTDCQSNYCNSNNICSTPNCNDGWQNQNETDIDCGESCSALGKKCANDQKCSFDNDCQSNICNASLICTAPSCNDGLKNQDETDVDCGGVCPACQVCNPQGGSLIDVNSILGYDNVDPTVAMDPQGNFVVSWYDISPSGDSNLWESNIWAATFNSNGIRLKGDFRVNSYVPNWQRYPAAAMDMNEFVITWSSRGQEGSGWNNYAQIYDKNGNRIGNEFRVNTQIPQYSIDSPSIKIYSNNSFVITWRQSDSLQDPGRMLGQWYNPQGERIGGEFEITNPLLSPTIERDSQGNFVRVWHDWDDSNLGIFAQQYDKQGQEIGSRFLVNSYTQGNQKSPDVAIEPNGNFVISWESFLQEGDDLNNGYGVYAQKFLANGTKFGNEFRVNSLIPGNQYEPDVTINENGDFIIVWRNGADIINARIFTCISPVNLCSNDQKDQGETDKDCGGICAVEGKRCIIDQGCSIDHDCVSNYCNPDTNKCDSPSDDTSRGANSLLLNTELPETLNLTDKTDWWTIDVPQSQYPFGGDLSVLLKFSSDQDFDLQVLDNNSNSLCHQVSRTNSVESCNLSIPPGRYSVKVYTINSIGSYLINNTFIPLTQQPPTPAVPVPVIGLQEKSHDADTICINWSHPSPITVNSYSIQEIINNNALTPQYRALPEFCNLNPYLANTNVTFNVTACNIIGCSEPRYISVKTDPAGCPLGIGGGTGAQAAGGGCDLQITDFNVTPRKIGNDFQVGIEGTILSQLGGQGLNVVVDVLECLECNPHLSALADIFPTNDPTKYDFDYTWTPLPSQYGKTFFIRVTAEAFEKEVIKIKQIKLSLLKDKKICVDPGHGGIDMGNQGYDDMQPIPNSRDWAYDGVNDKPNEADFNLWIALELEDLLLKNESQVIMTRKSDIFIDPPERVRIANNADCEIFVSIHQNAANSSGGPDPEPYAHGTETLYYSEIDEALAQHIHNKIVEAVQRANRGVKYRDNIYVLTNTEMPAALAEIAFSTNDTEFSLLNTTEFRKKAAQGIFTGIKDYFANKGSVVLEIQTTLAISRSPFTIVASVSNGFGNPTNILNDKKINESNFEVYLTKGGSPTSADRVEFTLEELALGLYQFTITPKDVQPGETLDLYISVIDKTQPEGQQLAGVDAVSDAVYIADPEGRPVVNLIAPLNRSVVKEGNVRFVYRANDERRIENCSLIVNGEVRAVDNEVIRGFDDSFELPLENGDYTWRVECRDDERKIGSSQNNNLRVGFCGATLYYDTILDSDLVCSGGGLVIGSSNIVLDCKGHTIVGNGIGSGIKLFSQSGITVKNCVVQNFGEGFIIMQSSNINLTNNIANNNNYGFAFISSSNNTFYSNKANDNSLGFFITSSFQNSIISNEARNNSWGFELQSSSYNTIISNIARENKDVGIYFMSSSINIFNSNVVDNNRWGIFLATSSSKNMLYANEIRDNYYGIYIDGRDLAAIPYENFIYNNLFNNTINARDLGGFNFWNTTKDCSKKNIIGGPCIGGNFWSDYIGEDTDGDGIGNTEIPYNSNGLIQNGGDYLPLVKKTSSMFIRGDSNIDGKLDISDAINTFNWLFLGTSVLQCKDAADVNDDGKIDISDPTYTLNFLFRGTNQAPPSPYPNIGIDPTSDNLTCESYNPPEQSGGGGGLTPEDILKDPNTDQSVKDVIKPYACLLNGDVDQNKKIDMNDYYSLSYALSGKFKIDELCKCNADVNEDKLINQNDASTLYNSLRYNKLLVKEGECEKTTLSSPSLSPIYYSPSPTPSTSPSPTPSPI